MVALLLVSLSLLWLTLAGVFGGVGSAASAAPLAQDATPSARYRAAQGFLRIDQPLRALDQAAACVAQAPQRMACWSVHGRALARLGRCEEALIRLSTVRGTPVWGAEDALAEARCRAMVGQAADAEASWREAVQLAHGRRDARVAEVAADIGWILGRLEVGGEGGAPTSSQVATTLRALQRGGWPVDAALLQEGSMEDPFLAWAACVRGLDAGDPEDALASRASVRPGGAWWLRGLVCRAEAYRRLGMPEEVVRMARGGLIPVDSVPWRWVWARALVDMGHAAQARGVLPPYALDAGPEGVATAWYVARALGDEAGVRAAVARWRQMEIPRDRRLEQLLPLRDAS